MLRGAWTMASDPHILARFVVAQDPVFAQACAELAAGHKHSHWMWFIFPQRYAIASLDEARAYLAHPILGERLRSCTQLVNNLEGRTAQEIFGYPDYLKFRSSMTLFVHAVGKGPDPFRDALAKYFAAEEDVLTRKLLAGG
jgi:uncharacterized protein (DUF1810 family)